MEFLQLAYVEEWITKEELRILVITKETPWGQITPEEYKTITGEEF